MSVSRPRGSVRAMSVFQERQQQNPFRLFTKESLARIERRAEETQREAQALKEKKAAPPSSVAQPTGGAPAPVDGEADEDEKPKPNPALEAGKKLPTKFGDFPPELYGKPIEDLDEFYQDKYTFIVVARDKMIFRFSATKGFYLLSPFNPIRRSAIYVLTHPFFGLSVMLVILVNCVFMATSQEIPRSE